MAAKGSFIVGFDSDVTIPDVKLLRKVQDTFEKQPDATGLAFRIFKPDGSSDDVERWWHPLPISKFSTQQFATSYFCGTAFAFRKAELRSAGNFPEVLFMHHEEIELALRVLDNGGNIIYFPHLTVIHHADVVFRRSEVQIFYHPRNQILIAMRCYPVLRGLIFLIPRISYQFLKALREARGALFVRAVRSAIRLIPICIKDRRPLREETWKRIGAMRQGNKNSVT